MQTAFCETYDKFFENLDLKLTFTYQEYRSEILTSTYMFNVRYTANEAVFILTYYLANQETKKQNYQN